MQKGLKLLFAMAAILAVGLMSASSAQASRGFDIDSTSIGASGQLVMNSVLTCDVLLQLNLDSRTLLKDDSVAQGDANGGYIRNCQGSLAGNPNTGAILGPIDVEYNSFSGALPNITGIAIDAPSAAFSVNTIAGTCLYQDDLIGVVFDRNTSTGEITAVDFDPTNSLTKSSGGFLCPTTGTIRGQLTTFLPEAPTVTLAD